MKLKELEVTKEVEFYHIFDNVKYKIVFKYTRSTDSMSNYSSYNVYKASYDLLNVPTDNEEELAKRLLNKEIKIKKSYDDWVFFNIENDIIEDFKKYHKKQLKEIKKSVNKIVKKHQVVDVDQKIKLENKLTHHIKKEEFEEAEKIKRKLKKLKK